MGRYTNRLKERFEEIIDNYEDALNEEFDRQFRDFAKELLAQDSIIEKAEVEDFMDNFTFPNSYDWAWDMVESELSDYEDQKYEEMRDREMGL